MITIKQKGDFSKTFDYFKKNKKFFNTFNLEKYAQEGINALENNTPKDTGLTSKSWEYEITKSDSSIKIQYYNTNIQNGINIAIILQYGHATGNGGWVEGIDYINPSIQPVFQKIADDAWREVTKV